MNPELEKLYSECEYSLRSPAPYAAYLRAIESVFDLNIVDSMCDVGCSSGWLLYSAHKRYPNMNILGLDYFEWAKTYADHSIRDYIQLADLSERFEFSRQFDFVNCSEVGEHIEPQYEAIFLDNIARLSKDILLLGWSEDVVEGGHQHVNPQSVRDIRRKVEALGFDIWSEATSNLRRKMREEISNGAYEWWYKPLTVYRRRRYLPLHSKRFVQGCATDGFCEGHTARYPGLPLQSQMMNLRDMVYAAVANRYPLCILRFGDGDLFFSHAIPIGSAKPGARALSIDYREKDNLSACRKGIFKADLVTTEIDCLTYGGIYLSMILEAVYRLFPTLEVSIRSSDWKTLRYINRIVRICSRLLKHTVVRIAIFPLLLYLRNRLRVPSLSIPIINPPRYHLEAIYALVASRLIFRMFPEDILLVGGEEKIDAVKALMEYSEFREYLGVKRFCGYVGVPQVGAADNEEMVLESICRACAKKSPKIILLGIGSAKLYLAPRIRNCTDAVIIDVGAGIDAIAGVISQDRPYFADWINFRADSINYGSMDVMDRNNPNRNSPKYSRCDLRSTPQP